MTDLWYSGAPSLESKTSKSIIHPFIVKGYSGLTINPYQGCHHRCAYCYATYEWSPDFYDKVYAKNNAAELLERQLANWKSDTIKQVMVSSATDCYQPAEIRFGLTRKCIEVLQKYNVPYYVFTKSALIGRDLELHRRYAHNCFIIWSITTCNENLRRVIEPGTPPSCKLFSTIKKFADAGIRCGVNIDPIIPLVSDTEVELDMLVDACKSAGLKHVFGSVMRLRSDIWDRMKLVLNLVGKPDAVLQYNQIYDLQDEIGSSYVSARKHYLDRIHCYLKKRVIESGMIYGFPNYLKPQTLNMVHSGQTCLTSFS